MGRRSGYQREPGDFKRGKVIDWKADVQKRQEVASKAQYRGNGAHKTYPAPNGEWTPSWRRGKARCWRFDQSDWPKLLKILREGLESGPVDEQFRGEFPARVWAYINGKLHEARLHNEKLGEYHGFPLEYPEQFPDDSHHLLRNAPHEEITVH